MSDESKYGRCPVLDCEYKINDEMLPPRPPVTFSADANEVITMLADTAEEIAVCAMIAHHVVDHTTAELMDTISALGAQLKAYQSDETVTLSRESYESLSADSDLLAALQAAGVDNWEGYAEVERP